MQLQSIKGKNLSLRPIKETDIPFFHSWRSDISELHLWFHSLEVLSLSKFSSVMNNFIENYAHVFMIIELPQQNDCPIGIIYSYKVDYLNGFAYICVFIDKKYRNSFYGAEASLLFLDYLFNYFPFRKIYSEVYEHNIVSLRNIRKGGCEQEGNLVKHIWRNGEYRDLLIFALYREYFFSRYSQILSKIKFNPKHRA